MKGSTLVQLRSDDSPPPVQITFRSAANMAVSEQASPLQDWSATHTPVRIPSWVLNTAAIVGNTTGVLMSTSKNAGAEPPHVTRKRCAVTGRSGMHCASRPRLPGEACANQSPGVQFAVLATSTVRVLEQL